MSEMNEDIVSTEQEMKFEYPAGPSGECFNATRPVGKQEKELVTPGSTGDSLNATTPLEHKEGVNLVEQSVSMSDSVLVEREEREDLSVNHVEQHKELGVAIVKPSDNDASPLPEKEQKIRKFDDMLDYLFECAVKEEDEAAAEAAKLSGKPLGDNRPTEAQEFLNNLLERKLKKQEENATGADNFAVIQRLRVEYEAFIAQPLLEALCLHTEADNHVMQLFFKPVDKSSTVLSEKRSDADGESQSEEDATPGTSSESTLKLTEKKPMRFMTPDQIENFETKIAGLEACVKLPTANPGDAVETAVSDIDWVEMFYTRLDNLKLIYSQSGDLVCKQISWSTQDKVELLLQLAAADFERICIVQELLYYDD